MNIIFFVKHQNLTQKVENYTGTKMNFPKKNGSPLDVTNYFQKMKSW